MSEITKKNQSIKIKLFVVFIIIIIIKLITYKYKI